MHKLLRGKIYIRLLSEHRMSGCCPVAVQRIGPIFDFFAVRLLSKTFCCVMGKPRCLRKPPHQPWSWISTWARFFAVVRYNPQLELLHRKHNIALVSSMCLQKANKVLYPELHRFNLAHSEVCYWPDCTFMRINLAVWTGSRPECTHSSHC